MPRTTSTAMTIVPTFITPPALYVALGFYPLWHHHKHACRRPLGPRALLVWGFLGEGEPLQGRGTLVSRSDRRWLVGLGLASMLGGLALAAVIAWMSPSVLDRAWEDAFEAVKPWDEGGGRGQRSVTRTRSGARLSARARVAAVSLEASEDTSDEDRVHAGAPGPESDEPGGSEAARNRDRRDPKPKGGAAEERGAKPIYDEDDPEPEEVAPEPEEEASGPEEGEGRPGEEEPPGSEGSAPGEAKDHYKEPGKGEAKGHDKEKAKGHDKEKAKGHDKEKAQGHDKEKAKGQAKGNDKEKAEGESKGGDEPSGKKNDEPPGKDKAKDEPPGKDKAKPPGAGETEDPVPPIG
jgi:hypothetical protein